MRLVTSGASLLERRLVVNCFLSQICNVAVAGQAGIDRIGLDKSWGLASVRIMARGAITLRPGMLHFGLLNFFCLVTVAGNAYSFRVRLCQDDLTVLRRRVAGVALSTRKGWMRVGLHQLWLGRLMGIVALYAVRGGERLSLMRFDQVRRTRVVAVEAKRRARLRQVIIELLFALFADFMSYVAGLATHIQCRVPAALLGYVGSLRVASKTEVLCFVAGSGLQKLILVVGLMRIVALHAIANRRRVNCPVQSWRHPDWRGR